VGSAQEVNLTALSFSGEVKIDRSYTRMYPKYSGLTL
jgi:hypothetical protein